MQVTPGVVLTDTEDITAAKLNLLGTPSIDLEDADKAALVAEVEAELGNGVAGKNYFGNPAFDLWTRGSSPVSCPAGVQTFRADSWWCRPETVVSLTPTYSRATDSVHQAYLYAAQVAGNTGVGAVDFGQNIAARIAAALANKCTVTVEIQNNTGATITPVLNIDTCNSFSDFSATTNRYSTALPGSITNGQASVFSVTIDTTAYAAQMRNGAMIYLTLPAGTMNSNAKFVNFYNWKLEIGETATQRYPEPVQTGADSASSSTTGTSGAVERNYVFNGELAENRFGANNTCAAGVQTFVAEGWWARPSGGSNLAYTKAIDSPNLLTKYSAKLTGDLSLSSSVVDFGQDIQAGNAAGLNQPVVFSCYVKNLTSAQITPTFYLDLPSTTLNDFTSVFPVITQQLDACPTNIWTRLSYTFNGAGFSNLQYGARLYLRFDTGVLNSGSQSVEIAQLKVELGVLATQFVPKPTFEVPGGVPGTAVNLGMLNTSASAISFTFDALAMSSPDGEIFFAGPTTVGGISPTGTGLDGLDSGTEGSSVWYAIWAISDGLNVHGLLSLSATAPTMPGGYRFKSLLGMVRNDGSANFVPFAQRNRFVSILPQSLWGNATSKGPANAATYEAVSVPAGGGAALAAIIPPNATAVAGNTWRDGTSGTEGVAVASTSAGIGEYWTWHQFQITAGMAGIAPGTGYNILGAVTFRVLIVTMQEFYWRAQTTTADKHIEITGFEL